MRVAIVVSLLATGFLFARDRDPQHISGRERVALETSSPRVHVGKMRGKHMNENARTDRVVSDKTTINAFVPVGK